MIEIDGSQGEGGGQVLRTSIALSSLLRKPVRISNVRIKRPKPGLAQQHLMGIKAAQDMTAADVKGLYVGSTAVEFVPGGIKEGSYAIDIGTAGSVSLILQVLLIPGAFSSGAVNITVRGGTDIKWAPPADFLKEVICPLLRKAGFKADIEIVKRGYYPKGGGEVRVKISPVKKLTGFALIERGSPVKVAGVAHSSNLPSHVLEREIKAAEDALKGYECSIRAVCETGFASGNGITLWAVYENSILGANALGEIGKPAEKVGGEAAAKLLEEMNSGAAVDKHAGDQLIPYMALADGTSEVTVSELTRHLKTNIGIVERILGSKFTISKHGKLHRISVKGIGFENEFYRH